uniref:Restriction endonuclease beta-beta-alpha-Me family protein n=1 Tax=Clandestinovirus TaxID=2831644 RepID=A0A8F8KR57_9VIRU|nr:restriction endonuclease beta-beta-alpha-Me family protein [Clandestinovirus]
MSQITRICPVCKIIKPIDVASVCCLECAHIINAINPSHKRRVVVDVTNKTCSKCHVTKPRSEFYVNNRNADGLLHRCRACQKEASQTNAAKRIIHNKISPTPDLPESTKVCKTCKKLHPLSMFPKNNYSLDGYSYSCRACRATKGVKKENAKPHYDEDGNKYCPCCMAYKNVATFTKFANGSTSKYCTECNNLKSRTKCGKKTCDENERQKMYQQSVDTLFQQIKPANSPNVTIQRVLH